MVHLGILASGQGTNFERIVDATRSGEIPNTKIACLITDRQAPALERAQRLKIPAYVSDPKNYHDRFLWMQAITETLRKHSVRLVVLAGFLRKIEPPLIEIFAKKIINIHPGLLPKFGGLGMYGSRVHERVLAQKESITGVTVHVVDELYDHGPIILEEKIPILPQDTPETLAQRVLQLEYTVYPKAIAIYLKKLGII